MANDATVDQQQLQSTINDIIDRFDNEFYPKYRDALRAVLNTIDVGDTQALGDLAAASNLSEAPVGDAAALRAAMGLGAAALRAVGTASGNVMEVGAFGVGVDPKVLPVPAVSSGADRTTDWNTLTRAGWWHKVLENCPNGPSGGTTIWYCLTLSYPAPSITQIAVPYGTSGRSGIFKWRTLYQGIWSNWEELLSTNSPNPTFAAMPTVNGSPIVESGSNSDGEWTRLADGTQRAIGAVSVGQINVAAGSLYMGARVSFALPIAFSGSANTRLLAHDATSDNVWMIGYTNATTGTLKAFCYVAVNSDRVAYYTAFGRWK